MAKKKFKVAGVTFDNGFFKASRQDVIKKCSVGDVVILEADYSNKHDDYAVKVITIENEQIGFIPKGKAKSKRVFLSLQEKNVTASVIDVYNFKNDSGENIYGIEIEVENLLTPSEAEYADQKGCVGVFLVLFGVLTYLKTILF